MKFVFVHIVCSLLFISPILSGCKDEPVNAVEDTVKPFEYDFIVAKDGSGDFITVQEALNAAPENKTTRTFIFIKSGSYKEKLDLKNTKKNIALIGENVDQTILTFDDFAQKINPETGQPFGTSGSRSFYIGGPDFYAQNITFENSAGPVGQALAVYIQGDRAVFNNCKFLGFQDTVYGDKGRQYFKSCYITGSTDFIFGPSIAVFDHCNIHSLTGNYITAASTPEGNEFGYVFLNCNLTAETGVQTYLGRPWRNFAKVVYLNCNMGAHVKPEGWHNWNKPEAEQTVLYAEYNCSGPGAKISERVSWSKQLSSNEAAKYSISNILKGIDEWDPVQLIKEIDDLLNSKL